MNSYLTPEEFAQQLKIETEDVLGLIEDGRVRAVRIGSKIRIPETELGKLEDTCAAVPTSEHLTLPAGSRWVFTRTGRARFRVAGSVATGAEIWPGKMQYPIKFPMQFMEAMLAHFQDQEVPVGGKFDDPTAGSLGEFIQAQLKIKMNPAVYLAALLIDEKYAEPAHRGYIRFCSKKP